MFSIGGKSSARISNSELHVRIGLAGSSSEDSPEIDVTNSTISFLYWNPRSIARISHSSIGRAVLDFRGGESENLTVEDLKTGKLEHMMLKMAEGGLLELTGTQIALPWSANFEILDVGGGTIAGKNVTFKNCNFEHIWCKIPPIKERVEIFELPSGHVTLFDFQEHVHGLDLPYNVTLSDCTLNSFKIELQKATVLIRDSDLMFHCHGDGNDAIVRNCRLVNHFNYGSGRVVFDNVIINGSLELLFCMNPDLRIYGERLGKGGNPNIIFTNSTLKIKVIVVACKNATISGTVATSGLSLENVNWYSGTVKRYFPLIVKDREGNPVIDVPVQLLNPRGRAANVGRTDESGRLVFNIDFTETNFKKVWRVCTQIEGEKVYRQVTFIESTPLVMQ